MIRSVFITVCVIGCILCSACNRKPKPASSNITKTAVLVNGKKDSVINNSQKNYGNATVAEPCIKCLIQVVQANSYYKKSVGSKQTANINYVVNWVTAQNNDTTNKKAATNAIKVDVVEKGADNHELSTFIYDNSLSKLYFIDFTANNTKIDLKTDSASLKRIRNSCYWGVASGK